MQTFGGGTYGTFSFPIDLTVSSALTKTLEFDANPYRPPDADATELGRAAKRFVMTSIVIGFLVGTASHWVLFWTDTLSTEFPAMGGLSLGLLIPACLVFPRLVQSKPAAVLAFAAGHVNAAFCRPLFLLNPFTDVPRDFVFAWTSAGGTFLVTFAIVYAALRQIGGWHQGHSPTREMFRVVWLRMNHAFT